MSVAPLRQSIKSRRLVPCHPIATRKIPHHPPANPVAQPIAAVIPRLPPQLLSIERYGHTHLFNSMVSRGAWELLILFIIGFLRVRAQAFSRCIPLCRGG